jgi:ABC-type antimicrobial peptide transport system permease subunit
MSFAVNQRKTEFGVRMALGADRPTILWMVLRQSSIQVIAGLVAGFGLCALFVKLAAAQIQQALFNVNPRDLGAYLLVGGIVVLTALIATSVPARRATKVDPITALRAE